MVAKKNNTNKMKGHRKDIHPPFFQKKASAVYLFRHLMKFISNHFAFIFPKKRGRLCLTKYMPRTI
jgi:hypothetical protein